MVSSDNNMHGCQQGKLVAGQYLLESIIAETALATFFRARDQMTLEADGTESSLILAEISDKLTGYPAFEGTLQRVLEEFDRPGSPLDIAGAYRDADSCWLIYNEDSGVLVADILAEGAGHDLALNQVQSILFNIFRAARSFMSRGGYGFLEPGAILCNGNSCKLLNAPLAIVFRVLTGVVSSPKDEWVFDSPYISPEVARGMLPSSQDDTFSLATIAYQLLSAKLPFGGASFADAIAGRQSPVPLMQLGTNGWKVMQQGLLLQRGRRQASPYALLQGFAGNVAGMDDLSDETDTHRTNKNSLFGKVAIMAGLGILVGSVSYHVYQGTTSVENDNANVIAQVEQHELVKANTGIEKVDVAVAGKAIPELTLPEVAVLEPVEEIPVTTAATSFPESPEGALSTSAVDPALSVAMLAESSQPEVGNSTENTALSVTEEQTVLNVQEKSERIIEEAILAKVETPVQVSVESEPAAAPALKPTDKIASSTPKPVSATKSKEQPRKKPTETIASEKTTTSQIKSAQKKESTVSSSSSRKKTMYASNSAPVTPARATAQVAPKQQQARPPRAVIPVRQVVQVSPNAFVVVEPPSRPKTVRQVDVNTFVVASD